MTILIYVYFAPLVLSLLLNLAAIIYLFFDNYRFTSHEILMSFVVPCIPVVNLINAGNRLIEFFQFVIRR